VFGRHHDLVNRCINSVLQFRTPSFFHYQMFKRCYTTVTTSGAGTAYRSGIPNFMHAFLIGSSCLNLRFPSSISVSNVILFCPFLPPIRCLFFDFRFLSTPLMYSSFSFSHYERSTYLLLSVQGYD
jgi:hypothetical protein